jgi:hypothetical protein
LAGETTTDHAFIAKLNAAGSAYLYNVTLPGTQVESATGIVVDSNGNAVAVGWTLAQSGGAQNVFVSKVDATGNLVLNTTLGGSGTDLPNAVQLDADGSIYVAGQTTSLDFPTTPDSFQPNPLIPMWDLSPGGFIFKLAANSTALAYSSYVPSLDTRFEGRTFIEVTGLLAVTASGDAYLAGSAGAGFPVTKSAPQICFGGSSDVFVAHFDPQGIVLDATYVGDTTDNTAEAMTLACDGSILLAWGSNDSTGSNSVSRIQFGSAGWIPPACLSPDALNAATLHSQGAINGRGVAPGEIVTLTGFGIGPEAGAKVLDWSRAQAAIMKPDSHARALNAIIRDLMETRDGATYFAGRLWGVTTHYDLGGDHPLVGHSVPNFEFEDGARIGELMHDGHGILLDFYGNPSLKTLANEYGDQLKYVSGRAKEQLGLSALLIRPDGFVAWASDNEPKEKSIRQAAALWFARKETI